MKKVSKRSFHRRSDTWLEVFNVNRIQPPKNWIALCHCFCSLPPSFLLHPDFTSCTCSGLYSSVSAVQPSVHSHSAKYYLLLPHLVLLHYYNEDSSNMLKSTWVWAAGDWYTFRTPPQGFDNPCWLTSFAFLLPTLLICRKHIVTHTNTFLCASRSFSSEMHGLAWLLFSTSDWC